MILVRNHLQLLSGNNKLQYQSQKFISRAIIVIIFFIGIEIDLYR